MRDMSAEPQAWLQLTGTERTLHLLPPALRAVLSIQNSVRWKFDLFLPSDDLDTFTMQILLLPYAAEQSVDC
jgi:hypothetical protein